MSKIYILLPVHNRKRITQGFVECLKMQTFTDYHLVLIDDGSTDGTASMVLEYIPDVTVLEGDGSWWWAGSLQRGIDWLKENRVPDDAIVLLANDDVTFEADYLANAVLVFNDRTGLMLLSRFSCDQGKTVDESGVVADLKRLSFRVALPGEEPNCLSTRGLFVRHVDIKKIGGFYTRLLPHYLSDYEYTIRAKKIGMLCETNNSVFLCPKLDATGYHEFNEVNLIKFLRNYFSIKSAANPIYLSVFVILAVPRPWILLNLGRVWYQSVQMVARQVVVSMRSVLRWRQ